MAEVVLAVEICMRRCLLGYLSADETSHKDLTEDVTHVKGCSCTLN